jgi:hypothetical protein
VFSPHPALPADGRLLFHRPRGGRAPVAEVAVLGITAVDDRAPLVVPADGVAQRRDHPVAAAPLSAALPGLLAATRSASPSVDAYVRAARLAVGLVAEHQVAPVLRAVDDEVVAT